MNSETLKINIENLKGAFDFINENTNNYLEKIDKKFTLKLLKNLIISINYDISACISELDEFTKFTAYKDIKEEITEFESKISDLEYNMDECSLLELVELPKYVKFTLKSLNLGVKFILKEAETKAKELEKKENKPAKKETKTTKTNKKLL